MGYAAKDFREAIPRSWIRFVIRADGRVRLLPNRERPLSHADTNGPRGIFPPSMNPVDWVLPDCGRLVARGSAGASPSQRLHRVTVAQFDSAHGVGDFAIAGC